MDDRKLLRALPHCAPLLLVAILLPACEMQTLNSFYGDELTYGGLSTGNPYFDEVRTIMRKHCAECHSSYLSLSEEEWVSKNYVAPGNPDGSILFRKLRGSETGGPEDMPPGTSLNSEQVQSFRAWIENLDASLSDSATRTQAALLVIQNRCSGCHTVTRTARSADFSGATVPAFANFTTDNDFVTGGLVNPGSTSTSWLYRSLKTYGDIGTMPKSAGETLTIDEAQDLYDWITHLGS